METVFLPVFDLLYKLKEQVFRKILPTPHADGVLIVPFIHAK
jgi:hypothetical protein